jgi:hypothetical protein
LIDLDDALALSDVRGTLKVGNRPVGSYRLRGRRCSGDAFTGCFATLIEAMLTWWALSEIMGDPWTIGCDVVNDGDDVVIAVPKGYDIAQIKPLMRDLGFDIDFTGVGDFADLQFCSGVVGYDSLYIRNPRQTLVKASCCDVVLTELQTLEQMLAMGRALICENPAAPITSVLGRTMVRLAYKGAAELGVTNLVARLHGSSGFYHIDEFVRQAGEVPEMVTKPISDADRVAVHRAYKLSPETQLLIERQLDEMQDRFTRIVTGDNELDSPIICPGDSTGEGNVSSEFILF